MTLTTPPLQLPGIVTNCNVAEHKHKEIKASAESADRRKIAEHIWRCVNDSQALKALADGVRWDAVGWDGRKWVERTVEAGAICQDVLQSLFSILPLAPAHSNDGADPVRRPHGLIQWEVDLVGGNAVSSGKDVPAWQTKVSETTPTAEDLLDLYKSRLGCKRPKGKDCASLTCADCWLGKGLLKHGTIYCFNQWTAAPTEASAGTGTLRGGQVKEAADSPSTWLLSEDSLANDVEIYVNDSAKTAGERGFRLTTLGRIAYFFEHLSNTPHLAAAEEGHEGEWSVWVAVQEFVSSGVGNTRKTDPSTGCDVFTLRQTISFFPASAIRSTVHMVHSCVTSGVSPCGLVSEDGKKTSWQCRPQRGASYLLNRYFHARGREAIA